MQPDMEKLHKCPVQDFQGQLHKLTTKNSQIAQSAEKIRATFLNINTVLCKIWTKLTQKYTADYFQPAVSVIKIICKNDNFSRHARNLHLSLDIYNNFQITLKQFQDLVTNQTESRKNYNAFLQRFLLRTLYSYRSVLSLN